MMSLPEGSLSLQIIIDSCSSSVKALDAYYKEKALVGAFSEHCQENYREIVDSFTQHSLEQSGAGRDVLKLQLPILNSEFCTLSWEKYF